MKITVAGSGNVAESLALAISGAGIEISQIYSRNMERGKYIADMIGAQWCGNKNNLLPVDMVIVAVSDGAVATVAASLPANDNMIVAHTAGCVGIDAISAHHRAVFYPFMTFTSGRKVDWSNIPIFIEASDDYTLDKVRSFANMLSGKVSTADATLRAHIHLAGVFANNFANAMFACAKDVVDNVGLRFDILEAIIAETASKAISSGNPSEVQTGPAIRGDISTLERHRGMLAEHKELKEIYDNMSEYIWQRKISKR